MEYAKIRKYYFTVCAVLLVLLFVFMLIGSHGRLTLQSVMSTFVGWLVLCAIIIGVVYMFVVKNRSNGSDAGGTAE